MTPPANPPPVPRAPPRRAITQAPDRRVITQAVPPSGPSAPVREPGRAPAARQVEPAPVDQPTAPIADQPVPQPETAPVASQALPDEVSSQGQVMKLDVSSYVQNNAPNSVYRDQQRSEPPRIAPPRSAPPRNASPQTATTPDSTAPPAPTATPSSTANRASSGTARPRQAGTLSSTNRANTPGAAASMPTRVTITVSPLEWRTLPFAGQPAIIGVRHVETPDGPLAQGFVIDRAALTSWLARHAGDAVAELRTGDNGSTEIVPGWHLEVQANPRALAAAAVDATGVARGFLVRFIALGGIAVLAALLVVILVARAERLARERSQFAAAAAHELRTPLAGLQLYGDMLADGLGDPTKMRDYARRMSEEASRLGRVVSNVLGFSQLERGNLSIDPRVGALGDALRELAERMKPALERTGATLALDVEPELSARFDRDALARIVGNLLDNAEKYGRGAADRTIALSARTAGDVVEVVVADHGPGITQAARTRLFRPFARGVSPDGPAGLGLGLALSQSLARAMGGDLGYRPVPGGGAAFALTLARG
jgi:signal transduction histidine kinase